MHLRYPIEPAALTGQIESRRKYKPGLFVAIGVVVAAFLAAKYNLNLDRLREHLSAPSPLLEIGIYIGVVLLALGGFVYSIGC